MKRIIFAALVGVLVSGIGMSIDAESSSAATFERVDSEIAALLYGLRVTGTIEQGDYEKFRRAVEQIGPNPGGVVLNSEGGDLLEGMKIGRLIRKLRWSTQAPVRIPIPNDPKIMCEIGRGGPAAESQCVCMSTCFFIYVAGINRYGDVLGIHRPHIKPEQAKTMTIDSTMTGYAKVKEIVISYLKEMGVPSSYFERMFKIRSDEIVMLSKDEAQSTLYGDILEVEEWKRARCAIMTPKERRLLKKILDRIRRKRASEIEEELYKLLFEKEMKEFECGLDAMELVREDAFVKEFYHQ